MIRQSLVFDDILEKKFKILRTSIMLGNLKNKNDTLKEYEETAREIDQIRKNVYEELLASKMYTTVTLEEEQTRLNDLITFIESRVRERNNFVDDYIKITSNFLDGLDKVSLEDELGNYKNRYNNIAEYLDNCNEIKSLNIKLKELRDELEEKYENKANNELINSKLEDELIDEFNNFISRNEFYSGLNYTDIELELSKLDESILEKKSVLDTFAASYQALVNAGISGTEREEYSSYVQDARINYYEDIEKRFILNIYKLVLDKQVDYEKLFEKRSLIDNILNDRNAVRASLLINTRDDLEYFVNLSKEQFSIIKSQKFNMESIDKLIMDISTCENRLSVLEELNNRSEIVDLIREFSVESVEIEKIDLPDEKHVYEEVEKFVEKTIEKKPSNMVVRVKEPIKIDVKSASDTAKIVMKKVVIVLEPKKFGSQRDKLREAEIELKKEKINNKKEEKKFVDKEIDKKNDFELNNEEDVVVDNIDNNFKNEESFVSEEEVLFPNMILEPKDDEIVNTFANGNDIFLDDDEFEVNSSVGVNLDNDDVFGDSYVDFPSELTQIKIHTTDPNDVSLPSEIFMDDYDRPREYDLFKETDPFLDDNEFELSDKGVVENSRGNMPLILNIGSVKPNNALSKIENVVKDNDDVILPNLGLVDEVKNDVPIVGENYIG